MFALYCYHEPLTSFMNNRLFSPFPRLPFLPFLVLFYLRSIYSALPIMIHNCNGMHSLHCMWYSILFYSIRRPYMTYLSSHYPPRFYSFGSGFLVLVPCAHSIFARIICIFVFLFPYECATLQARIDFISM